ncbi:MAG: putative L(+)-tartrate dehydratase subunit alpha [Promethearchaeota archaeon]|nr:MAG: putative L(+)-tartrate dehydratase subunit alpha [Candidatus Lokiarchaeota archaeon]
MLQEKIETAIIDILTRVTIKPRPKIIEILNKNFKSEQSEIARAQLIMMLENFKYGKKNKIPVCQDTGMLNFFIELGSNFPLISNYRDLIDRAVQRATKLIPLRGNSVDPITNENPETNTGINVPPIYLRIVDNKNTLKIIVFPKGGGAENISKLFMLNPSNGINIFQEKIIDVLKDAGGMPCPPILLGIGIGGDAVLCMKLAKEALLRQIEVRNQREDIARLEMELLEKVNALHIGPMGLGGSLTCIDVHIEIAMRHPASFPVGLIVQCYSHRWASFEMDRNGVIIDET